MINGKTIGIALAAAVFAAPASATPTDTRPTAASSTSGSGCYVNDANGATTYVPSCSYRLQTQFDTAGNLISAQYHDNTQAPAGAALPSSAIIRDISFDNVRCTERLTPSGQYTSNCYFQSRSQAYP